MGLFKSPPQPEPPKPKPKPRKSKQRSKQRTIYAHIPVKRGPGRPKGSKNKPKRHK